MEEGSYSLLYFGEGGGGVLDQSNFFPLAFAQ